MGERTVTPSWILRALTSGFLVGLLFASFSFSEDGSVTLWVLGLNGGLLFLGGVFYFRRILFVGLLLGAGCLAWLMYASALPGPHSIAFVSEETVFLEATVMDVEATEQRQKVTLNHVLVEGAEAYEDHVLLFTPLFPSLEYGDVIRFSCRLESPEPFEGFAYDRYLATKGIYKSCSVREAPLVVDHRAPSMFVEVLLRGRAYIVQTIDRTFGEPQGSLLVGLLLGEQRFTEDWEDLFVKTGTTHIVAASGYNVAVVTFLLFSLLTYFGLRRQRAFWVILFGILCYVILAGADAPVVRAGIMGGLILTSKQVGRKTTMTNILLLTFALMLVAFPFWLRDDVGFQLSALSTVGLIYLAPHLERRLRFIPEVYTLRESLTATLAATITTLPVTLFAFGTFSPLAPVANLLVLPLIPYAMAFGATAISAGFVSTAFGSVAAGPSWALLTAILWVIESLASLV